ncbi:hypothetical protein WJ69_09185 [Burkholderia ubonensis]|nr:hypothetical protein WJ69_09185 [Burkholderia ubonensis]
MLSMSAEAKDVTPSVDYGKHQAIPTPVDEAKKEAAMTVARLLSNPAFSSSIAERLDRTPTDREKVAPLHDIMKQYQGRQPRQRAEPNVGANGAIQVLRRLDDSLLAYKGVSEASEGLLQLRLYQPAVQPVTAEQVSHMLVAFEPAGDDEDWDVVEAYDSQGNLYRLDARRAPTDSVLVVDIDAKEDVRAGLVVANKLLAARSLQDLSSVRRDVSASRSARDRLETTKLERISLNDDQEPWISGAAEVYAVVSGIQPSQPKPQIELVDMPYLDYAGQTYTPGQVLVYWSAYRYGAASIQFYEHDDNTNYQDLAVALASGVSQILGAFKPEFAVIAAVASAILQAMPSSWFYNSDDYIDSFYAVEKGRRYPNYVGAANNATITLEPYVFTEGS